MRDFGAILKRAALEVVKINGPGGPTGPGYELPSKFNPVNRSRSGTTSPVELVPVVPNAESAEEIGTTGTSGPDYVVPAGYHEKCEQSQLVESVGTTGTIGTTKIDDVREKSDLDPVRLAVLRNSLDFFEMQTDTSHCFVCHEREDGDRPFVPVCTPSPGRNHWIHLQCHGAHVARVKTRAEAALANIAPF